MTSLISADFQLPLRDIRPIYVNYTAGAFLKHRPPPPPAPPRSSRHTTGRGEKCFSRYCNEGV